MAMPDLVEVQRSSYDWFFKTGIKELFEEISPITDFTGRDLELYFEDYYIDEPKFDEVTCRDKISPTRRRSGSMFGSSINAPSRKTGRKSISATCRL